MPVFRASDGIDHHAHGSTFSSYVAPSRGSDQLCAWRLTVPPGLAGVAHRPSREEVVLLIDGQLRITLDGTASDLRSGDVAVVPAGSELRLDSGPSGATAWITSTSGLEAVMADGTRFAPPWVR